jgi:hypothetical protein
MSEVDEKNLQLLINSFELSVVVVSTRHNHNHELHKG